MTGDHGPDGPDPYARWDAAYVLGALSSARRREFEDHLPGCRACRSAVSEISGVPALLALLDHDPATDPAADGSETSLAAEPPPGLRTALLRRVGARRRRRRWFTAAAAALVAIALSMSAFVALRPGTPADTEALGDAVANAEPMTPMTPSEFEAAISLSPQDWGTMIHLTCTYHSWSGEEGDGGDELVLVALARDGSATRLASWVALPAATALPTASTALPITEIAAVQVVSADSGTVLLQRTL